MPPSRIRMSEELAGPPSPTPSLIDVKAETHLVLKSFLRHALSLPLSDRPGRIGGAYCDPNKYSALVKEKQKKDESGWDSLDEKISAAEERKHDIKNLIKRRLRPRPRHGKKDSANDPTLKGSVDKQGAPAAPLRGGSVPSVVQSFTEDVKSSASEEETEQKTDEKKKKKNKLKLPEIFRKKSTKKEDVRPTRPGSLPIDKEVQPPKPVLSPTHPPAFYDGVAEKLDRIAQRTVRRKSPTKPEAFKPKEENKENKEAIVQQLVHLLTMEGDAMNEKIEANPFLRSSLNRLSYASFARLLDTYANETIEPPLPAPESPTLRRVAITMEVTRRVVTATGVTQRVEGYAERYMENFAPWVKSHGGWESIAQMEAQEFD
ncbi:apoptosis facilitator Bcl-2-like protein 14 isoform X2 [Trichomycterus rosablanca]|uniref:apoptosis facilitator Bcl-2-like protein 14 isoform X2 n=1 Tax=Trichomycterus rosablanca TaxID=2290929 RepID=UPI002F355B61